MELSVLRGRIIAKYRTLGAFADAVGWKRNKASRIVNGAQDMDINDIQVVAHALDIDDCADFITLFFPAMSTKWTA